MGISWSNILPYLPCSALSVPWVLYYFKYFHIKLLRDNLRKWFFSADPSGRAVWDVVLRLLACWSCGFESQRGHGCLSVVCCQVEVSATGWSFFQRSPTDCGASSCVSHKPQEWGGHGPLWATAPQEEKLFNFTKPNLCYTLKLSSSWKKRFNFRSDKWFIVCMFSFLRLWD